MQERICGYRALLHRPHRTCEIPLHADFPNGCRPGMGGRISNELCAFPFPQCCSPLSFLRRVASAPRGHSQKSPTPLNRIEKSKIDTRTTDNWLRSGVRRICFPEISPGPGFTLRHNASFMGRFQCAAFILTISENFERLLARMDQMKRHAQNHRYLKQVNHGKNVPRKSTGKHIESKQQTPASGRKNNTCTTAPKTI